MSIYEDETYIEFINYLLDNFTHIFIVSFLYCAPFLFFITDKYIKKKEITHFEAWSPYLFLLSFCILINTNRIYNKDCNIKCLYIIGNTKFKNCCIEKWLDYY